MICLHSCTLRRLALWFLVVQSVMTRAEELPVTQPSNLEGGMDPKTPNIHFLISSQKGSRALCLQRTDFHISLTAWSLRWANCDVDDETQRWLSHDGHFSGTGAWSRKRHVAMNPPVPEEYISFISRSEFGIFASYPEGMRSGSAGFYYGLTSLDYSYDPQEKVRKPRQQLKFFHEDLFLKVFMQEGIAHLQKYCVASPTENSKDVLYSGFDGFKSSPAILVDALEKTQNCAKIDFVVLEGEQDTHIEDGDNVYTTTGLPVSSAPDPTQQERALVQAAISIMHEGSTKIASM